METTLSHCKENIQPIISTQFKRLPPSTYGGALVLMAWAVYTSGKKHTQRHTLVFPNPEVKIKAEAKLDPAT